MVEWLISMELDYFLYTSAGGRSPNEDAIGIKDSLFVVADGLGGHADGSLASKCVVGTFLCAKRSEQDVCQWFHELVESAHRNVTALQQEKNNRMKSTVVSLFIQADKAYWLHVGDSRLYRVHDDSLDCTADHSVAYKKYLSGEITRSQIGKDEDQNRLLRALGNEQRHNADTGSCLIEAGNAFLLCTDGVWSLLQEEEIMIDYYKSETAQEWAENLLLRVLDRCDGNHDNLSLITVLCKTAE